MKYFAISANTKSRIFLVLKICLGVYLIFYVYSCIRTDYDELEMPAKNPVVYEFNASVDSINYLLKKNRKNFPFNGFEEFSTDSISFYKSRIFKDSLNVNDMYVECLFSIFSKIYVRDKEPLKYTCFFHIHLEKISEFRTRVTINTTRSNIVILEDQPLQCLTHYSYIGKDVAPSTIEEYMILLYIGNLLGVSDSMPELILPKPKRE